MNFKPELLAKVLNGTKTQTRRTVKPGEHLRFDDLNGRHYVRTANGHMKWYESGVYAAAPGRSKHGVARFRLLHIRREDVRQISNADVLAEGFADRFEFFEVWCGMHDKPAFTKHTELTADSVYDISRTWDKRYREQYLCDWIEIALPQRPRERYDVWALTFEVKHD